MSHPAFVFLDPKGKRWTRIRVVSLAGSALLFAAFVVFVNALLVQPKLRNPADLPNPDSGYRMSGAPLDAVPKSPAPPTWLKRKGVGADRSIAARKPVSPEAPVMLAMYSIGTRDALRSLETHYRAITHLAPDWLTMKSFDQPLVASNEEDPVVDFARSAGVKLMPMLTNIDGDDWQPEVVEDLARHPDKRPAFIEKLLEALADLDAAGVVVDWEQIDSQYRDQLTSLIADLSRAIHKADLKLWLAVPVGSDVDAFDLDALAPMVDRLVAMLFDENGENDTPGPIASHAWWIDWLDALLEHGSPRQWVAAIGNYGYDWPSGENATVLSFPDAMARIKVVKGQTAGTVPPLYEPHFNYQEDGVRHSVWFLDAVTFRNQLALARKRGIGGAALYSLGNEDPAIWEVVADPGLAPEKLSRIEPGRTVANIGKGDLLTVADDPRDGSRSVDATPSGLWESRYESIPKYPLIYHRGGLSEDEVVLTFDDGPDPVWTPQILDILKRDDVHAVFFLVGERAIENPDLVRRIFAEGHEIGNHSYSHPDLSNATEQRTVLELNANQRILEQTAGISTLLFRPPYHADTVPETFDQFLTLVRAQALGYLSVTESVDSEDWNDPTPEKLLQRVKERRPFGNVLLMHDGGGDRSATVAALPEIIRALRDRGDRIVTLQPLLDLPRAAIMPPIRADDPADSRILAGTGLSLLQKLEELAWAFMIGITVLLFVRSAIVMWLALRHRHRQSLAPQPVGLSEPVSILIAAYNESKVIESTIRSVLDTDYPGPLEVIVVDDGSTDGTGQILAELAACDPRIRPISQTNQGKAAALDRALRAASNELIAMLDADTQLRKQTIRHLVAPLADPKVGAVSGHILVGNPTTPIARFQALEYICGFNLDRRAYDRWDAVTVVPGATSAFRKSAIEEAGGIVGDTLAEDTDLTFFLHRAGYRIRYAPGALAYTEAPDSVRGLVKQRVRWAFGTLQCLWKHRDLVFRADNPGLGFFSLPSIWFCHVFLVALVPVVDLALILSLLWGAGSSVAIYAIFFLALDWIMALFGCYLERAPLRTALWIFPMRLVYRPLLCYAVWTSILRALRGAWYGWGKLDRKGTVQLGYERSAASGKGAIRT